MPILIKPIPLLYYRLQRDRDERRRVMEQAKIDRAAEDQRNRDAGNPGDVDFQRMIRGYREHPTTPMEQPHRINEDMKICICVRKRPVSVKEVRRNDYDSVTCLNPLVVVHDCKLKVDGISKYLDNQAFQFDHTFHEENTTEDVYGCAVQPLVEFCVHKGKNRQHNYPNPNHDRIVKTITLSTPSFAGLTPSFPSYHSSTLVFQVDVPRCLPTVRQVRARPTPWLAYRR